MRDPAKNDSEGPRAVEARPVAGPLASPLPVSLLPAVIHKDYRPPVAFEGRRANVGGRGARRILFMLRTPIAR